MEKLIATKRRAMMKRFDPTKEELLLFLKKRITNGYSSSFPFIRDADVYSESPDQLTQRFSSDEVQREWYFFTRISPKSSSSTSTKGRVSRIVGQGTWRGTQKVKHINDINDKITGSRKSFEYVLKRPGAKDEKTIWLMEEFSLKDFGEYCGEEELTRKVDRWVLCKIYVTPRAQPKPLSCCNNGADGGERLANKGPALVPAERTEMDIVETSTLVSSSADGIACVADKGLSLVPTERRGMDVVESPITERQVGPYTALLTEPYLDNDMTAEDLWMYLNNLPPINDLPPLDTDNSMDF